MVYIHNIDPVLLDLGPIEIRYYGLVYVIGFIVAYFLLRYLSKRKNVALSEDELETFLLYAAVGVLVGSRVFYFLFYNFSIVLENPLQLFKIWEGGMSFHGGLIGVLVGGFIFCKQYKKDFYEIADILVIPTVIGLGIGRIANFINAELYGRATTIPWAVDFGDGVARHPSQLYESAKNFVIFAVLWILKDKNLKKGTLFWTFIMLYGTFRFFIEFVRQPDSQLGFVLFGFFSMGQVLTGIMALLGAGILISWHCWPRKP
ncbi:MAG: prolipoprotein diacylglyceryl transferase [Nanoarchaeota archaeon]